jgi:hypothetical protein
MMKEFISHLMKAESLEELEQRCREELMEAEESAFISCELEEIEVYLKSIPSIIGENLRKTYLMPEDKWQIQQTNGFRLFKSGRFPFN